MRIAGLFAGAAVLLSLAACVAVAAEDEAAGMSVVPQSLDDPPIETPSSKVKVSRNPDQPPARGPDPAKVYLVVFCDYETPECGRMTRAIRQIPDEFPGEVRLEFRQVPPRYHPKAEAAAVAALAAHRQGKFWPMHECLLAHQESLDDATFDTCAREAALEPKTFAKDRSGTKLLDRVRAEAILAHRLGILRAPAYTLNGRVYVGWGSWELLRGGVSEERMQVDKLLKQGKKLPEVLRLRATQNVPKNPDALKAYTTVVQHLHAGLPKRGKT